MTSMSIASRLFTTADNIFCAADGRLSTAATQPVTPMLVASPGSPRLCHR
jgi:hypothetical protein